MAVCAVSHGRNLTAARPQISQLLQAYLKARNFCILGLFSGTPDERNDYLNVMSCITKVGYAIQKAERKVARQDHTDIQ